MKQRAIRERRNHKPQDARRFNCRLNCGPTRTYATTLEATRPSLSRALPISSLALAALLASIARYTLLATLCPVCLAHLMHSLTFAVPSRTISQQAPHLATWLCKMYIDCRRLPSLSTTIRLVPQFSFCFGSLVTMHARLQKRKACALMWLESHPRRRFRS